MSNDNFITWYFKTVVYLIKQVWKQALIIIPILSGAIFIMGHDTIRIPYWVGFSLIFVGIFLLAPYFIYLDYKHDKERNNLSS